MAAHSGLADLNDNGTSDRKVQEMTVSASRALPVLVARMSRILELVHTVLVTNIYSTAAGGGISPGYGIRASSGPVRIKRGGEAKVIEGGAHTRQTFPKERHREGIQVLV